MKKALVVVLMMLVFSGSLFSAPQLKDMYVKTTPIIKIYTHKLGYKIYYLKENTDIASFHVPVEWFFGTEIKGEIVWGKKADYPYFAIYWEDGEFSYIRLFLHRNMSDDSWGVLKTPISELEDDFDIEKLNLDFRGSPP